MSAPLTLDQKRKLAKLSRQAYVLAGAQTDGANVDDWRRGEVAKACGKYGLRCCSQDDYGAVYAHFLAALGKDAAALRAAVHGDPAANRKRQWVWHIRRELDRLHRGPDYAEGICRRMSRGAETLDTAGEKILQAVCFALRKVKVNLESRKA